MNGAEILTKFTADTTQVNKATTEINNSFTNMAEVGKLAFTALTLAADAFAISLLSDGVEYNKQIETYMVSLEAMLGSTEEAEKAFKRLKEDARKSPFDTSSLLDAEQRLVATGKGADEAADAIMALGDAVAYGRGGNAELQRMAQNLQQIANNGKATSMDIKQFGNAGIPIMKMLADSTGYTTEELSKMDITYDMIVGALKNASKQGGMTYGMMEKQSKTLNGQTKNLKQAYNEFTGSISEGLFNAVRDLIPYLVNMLDWLTQNKDIVLAIATPLLVLANLLVGLFVVDKVTGGFKLLHAVLMNHPLFLIITAISALIAAFVLLWNKCEWFREFWIGLWEAIKTSAQNAWILITDTVIDPFVAKILWVVDKVLWVKDTIVGAWNTLKEGTETIFNGIRDTITNVFNTIGEIIKTPINAIVDAMNEVIDGINSLTVPDWVPGIGGKHTNFKHIPRLATGTNYVPQDMLAVIHEGEAVVPKKFNPYANGINPSTMGSMGTLTPSISINIENNMEMDTLGQVVNKVKTYSGGAKNDFNYGMGGR